MWACPKRNGLYESSPCSRWKPCLPLAPWTRQENSSAKKTPEEHRQRSSTLAAPTAYAAGEGLVLPLAGGRGAGLGTAHRAGGTGAVFVGRLLTGTVEWVQYHQPASWMKPFTWWLKSRHFLFTPCSLSLAPPPTPATHAPNTAIQG